jgi:hypothetical protein
MQKLNREVVVMPDNEYKDFLKLVKHEKKPKSRVIRGAIIDKVNQVLDKVVTK